MPHHWPSEPPLVRWELDVLDRGCRVCGRKMHVCAHRRHPVYTLQGPRLLVNRLVRCVDRRLLQAKPKGRRKKQAEKPKG